MLPSSHNPGFSYDNPGSRGTKIFIWSDHFDFVSVFLRPNQNLDYNNVKHINNKFRQASKPYKITFSIFEMIWMIRK